MEKFEELQSQIDDLAHRVGNLEQGVGIEPLFTLEETRVNTFVPAPIPLEGIRRINKSFFHKPANFTVGQFKLTAVSEDIVLGRVTADGMGSPLSPYIEGIETGDIIPKGSHRIFRCRTQLTGGKRYDNHFFVEVGSEVIIDMIVRVSTQYFTR